MYIILRREDAARNHLEWFRVKMRYAIDKRERRTGESGDKSAFIEDAIRLAESIGRLPGSEGEDVVLFEEGAHFFTPLSPTGRGVRGEGEALPLIPNPSPKRGEGGMRRPLRCDHLARQSRQSYRHVRDFD